MPGVILIIASLDTKWPEIKYLKELIEQRGHKTMLLDMSMRSEPPVTADIPCEAIAVAGGSKIEEIRNPDKPRDESTDIMIQGAIVKALEIYGAGELLGIISVGGVTNAVMGTTIMKAIPFGIPKLMVCSAAMPSYLGGFFGSSDIALLSSVVDMAGLHELSKNVLKRAAGASLSFNQPPVKLHCRKCNIDYTSDSFDLICPRCHTMEIDILSGSELYVESMEAE